MRSAGSGLRAGPAGAAALSAVTYLTMSPGRPVRGSVSAVLATDAKVALPHLACSAIAAASVLRLR